MERACRKFLNMMDVELKDLELHIEALINNTMDRYREDGITENVCLSNLAVLRKEKHAVGHFRGILRRMDSEKCESIEELVASLRRVFRSESKTFDLSEAACHFAEHKMERVEDYVTNTHWSEEKQEYLDSVDVN